MSKRPITALMAALALLAVTPAASHAQTPTPTPTATASQQDDGAAEAPDDASKEVKAIYTDYSRDGKIDVCDHARDDLQEALDSIEADFDRDFPDFREALEAGIQRHDDNRCEDDTRGDADPDRDARRLDDHRPAADADTRRRRAPGPRHLDRRRWRAPTRRRHAAARRQRRAARGGDAAGGRRRAGADGGPHGRSARRRDDARREPDARDRHPLGCRRPADSGDHGRRRAARRSGARLLGDQGPLPARAARVERGAVPRSRHLGRLLRLAQGRPLKNRPGCGLPHPGRALRQLQWSDCISIRFAGEFLPPATRSERLGATTVPSEARCIVHRPAELRFVPAVGTLKGERRPWSRCRRTPHSRPRLGPPRR